MFYTIYKITNTVNNKIYIGKHQTADIDDGYMGSGKHLKSAIEKYGIENFKKEILFQFDNELDMNAKESELVTEDFCLRGDTYNICVGGKGGWSYINSVDGLRTKGHTPEMRKRQAASLKGRKNPILSQRLKIWHKEGKVKYNTFTGKKHSEETKQILSIKAKERLKDPTKSSQYGTCWITNGIDNRKIKKDVDLIPEGWYNGRTMKTNF